MISMMITQPNGRQVSSIVSMKDINRFCITIKVIKKNYRKQRLQFNTKNNNNNNNNKLQEGKTK